MRTTETPPTPKDIRLTIPVTPEVHAAFTRIAKAGNMPTGRAMGEWLGDTLDAALFMADKMEQARSAPSLVARELHSYALGLSDMTSGLMEELRKGPSGAQASASAVPAGPVSRTLTPTPPPSNTGGESKLPKQRKPPKGTK
jgi:hypothetical protein